jgi:hypothetical protein
VGCPSRNECSKKEQCDDAGRDEPVHVADEERPIDDVPLRPPLRETVTRGIPGFKIVSGY